MTKAERIHVLEVAGEIEFLAALEETVVGGDLAVASTTNADTGQRILRVFCPDDESRNVARHRLESLVSAFRPLFPDSAITWHDAEMEHADWAETWKEHFHTFRASRRLVVKPSWEEYVAQPDDIVVEIDPGMSFGTGYHGTTRACMQYLDRLAERLGACPLLDAGCGSGILSLAACKLGFRPVVAFDHDPQALLVSRENAERLGVDICFSEVDLGKIEPEPVYRVVVANILAPVLVAFASQLTGFLGDDGVPSYLVLSGILTEQYDEVARCYKGLGLTQEDRTTIDGWTSGLFRSL